MRHDIIKHDSREIFVLRGTKVFEVHVSNKRKSGNQENTRADVIQADFGKFFHRTIKFRSRDVHIRKGVPFMRK
jgi:hypothetical protein